MTVQKQVEFLQSQHALKTRISTCTLCPTVSSPGVPLSGTVDRSRPVYLVIGEAPGPDEHQQGKPFVGKAGRFLRRMLEEVQIFNVVFGNTIQCYPGTIRRPTKLEVTRCFRHFTDIVGLVDPDLTLLLGNTALQNFWPDARIGKERSGLWRGTRYREMEERWFMATWHPSAVLREQQGDRMLREFRGDLRRFAEYGGRLWLDRRLGKDGMSDGTDTRGSISTRRDSKNRTSNRETRGHPSLFDGDIGVADG